MTRLRALNESSSDDSEEESEEKETIEAQEERAFSLYQKALEFRQQKKYPEAEQLLISLLNDDFLNDVCPENQQTVADGLARPATALKYACLKNLGSILVLQDRAEDGLKCFLQAIELDESDVTMWHQMGNVALQIDNFDLASLAYQEGLRCNPRHWPCLDSLMPVLFALNDYLGCLLLVSRSLQLDPDYPQALAMRCQINKEHPNLLSNFKYFFPDESDILEVRSTISEDEAERIISHFLSLQRRRNSKTAHTWSNKSNLSGQKDVTINLQSNTWESLGKSFIETYNSILASPEKSFLEVLKIQTSKPAVLMETDSHPISSDEKGLPPANALSTPEIECEPMDVDSEQDAKAEDQTEEDATEASGLEQEEEVKVTCTVEQSSSALKRKRKRSSLALIDQWSKRRSGRRSGRKIEDREESNLAACFRSLLPESLLPKDLEAEIARASKRRTSRNAIELMAWGEDSMDTVELCRLLQERDAKNDQNNGRQSRLDSTEVLVKQENYFGTEKEFSDVCSFIETFGRGTQNIIELLLELTRELANRENLTWPCSLVPIYTTVYECMRSHIPYPSPVGESECSENSLSNFYAALLYCELFVDLWQQRNPKDQDIFGEAGFRLSEALGNIMLLSGLSHIFPSSEEHFKIILRIQWLKAHIFLTQENASFAIYSLQDVLESLKNAEKEEMVEEKQVSVTAQLAKETEVNEDVPTTYEVAEPLADSVNQKSKTPNSFENADGKDVLLETNDNSKSDVVLINDLIKEINNSVDNQNENANKSEDVVPSIMISKGLEDSSHAADESQANAGSVQIGKEELQEKEDLNVSELHPFIKEEGKDDQADQLDMFVIREQDKNATPESQVDAELGKEDESTEQNVIKSSKPSDNSEVNTSSSSLKNNNSTAQPIAVVSTGVNKDMSGVFEDSKDNLILTAEVKSSPLKGNQSSPSELSLPETNVFHTEGCQYLEEQIKDEIQVSEENGRIEDDGMTKKINNDRKTVCSPPQDSCTSFRKSDCRITLPNSRFNQVIDKWSAQKLLTSLTRQQQLSEVDELYQNRQYETLAATLTECFKYCAQQVETDNPDLENLPDRATQMAMLLDSLWQLQRYSDCFYWTEACLHEAFNRYLNSTDSDNSTQDQEDHQSWATTVERLLAGLNGCLKVAGLKLLEKLPKPCLTRLVQTLTSMLCQQLEQSDCSVEMAIECMTPWVILHRIVYFEELEVPKPEYEDRIPSHMSILFTAHESMAKKSRCCLNEGILLNLILDVVVPQIRSMNLVGVRHKLNYQVEQAILCLYGHPKKQVDRSKKKLQDHKVHLHLELTWERSLTLLKYYEPDELPTFDSTSKISPDEEQLFLRVLQLVPEQINPSHHLKEMKPFLRGVVNVLPNMASSLPEAASNLYYLLADYYLKTMKWDPAIKFYMLDLCLNPDRFDSWAGMALARATLLSLDINSCDTFKNEVQLRRMMEAEKCFQKAVDLDPENCTMLIEFGNFAYTAHSFCSRLLKTETDSLSMEMFTKIEEEKDKMLALTEKCFKTADKINQDERWLHQYMLGKVAEKRGEGPLVYLPHYRAAARLLYESNAEYPLSLNYDPPQLYAFEAHEVHYRIHASILKNLESMEGKCLSLEVEKLFEETLNEAALSPFMAPRGTQPQVTLMNVIENQASTAKRMPLDSSENPVKRIKVDESVSCANGNKDSSVSSSTEKEQKEISNIDNKDHITLQTNPENFAIITSGEPGNLSESAVKDCSHKSRNELWPTDQKQPALFTPEVPRIEGPQCASNVELKTSGDDLQRTTTSSVENMVESLRLSISKRMVEDLLSTDRDVGTVSEEGDQNKLCSPSEVDDPKLLPKDEKKEIATEKKVTVSTKNSLQASSPSSSSSSDDSCSEPENAKKGKESKQHNFIHNSEQKNSAMDTISIAMSKGSSNILTESPLNQKSFDHTNLTSRCLTAIEECLVRYNRHYKSFYRLCHYYYHSKQHRNLKKCRQLLLGDYRVMRVNKNVNGLFKSGSFNSMFNDVWRMPVEDIDRAGSFASHMSRCVHLLMELLRAQRDHALLLKLSLFLKREPEKKDKKYLRDNERVDLSKQALVMCLAALRESANQIRSADNVIEVYHTVKDGIKELPQKDGTLKNILSDSYKRLKGLSQMDTPMYDTAVEFCQNELNLRKVAQEAKVKAQAAAQVQAQAMQMGVSMMSSGLPFTSLTPRFPSGINAPPGMPSLANQMYLPPIPVYRGRGRPPKAHKQLQNAFMNMAQMLNLGSTAQLQGSLESTKMKPMKLTQRQSYQQTISPAPQSSIVSSLIEDRPSISITALPSNQTANASSTVTGITASSSIAPMKTVSPISHTTLSGIEIPQNRQNHTNWQGRPQLNFTSSVRPPSIGSVDPREFLKASVPVGSKVRGKGTVRFKPPRKSPSSGNASFPSSFLNRAPGPYVPQSQTGLPGDFQGLMNPRVSGPQVGVSSSNQQFKHAGPSETNQPIDRVKQSMSREKSHSIQVSSSQSALSISKISVSQSAPRIGGAESSEQNRNTDVNFDIITLD